MNISQRVKRGILKIFAYSVALIFAYNFVNISLMKYKDVVRQRVILQFLQDNSKILGSLNNSTCKIPEYNLYDPSIRQYVNRAPLKINCGRMQPYLTYLDWNGVLHVNETEVVDNKYNNSDFSCYYQEVTVSKENDYIPIYGEIVNVTFPMPIRESTIRVKCITNQQNNNFYTMVHTHIKPLDPVKIRRNKELPSDRPSVLIFGMDSMSRRNFIRSMPLTHKYLVEEQGMMIFKGLNKVADNSFSNMMALLAGMIACFRKHHHRGMPIPMWCPKKNSTTNSYDDMPIVWKYLQEQGYVTMYCEEHLNTIFSFIDVGFREDPVDYYFRAPYVALKDSLPTSNKYEARYCLGNEPSFKYMLNYTEEFLVEMAQLKYFALSFFVEMSHDVLTDVRNMDVDVHDFFAKLFAKNYLNNTVVLVIGDHGHRMDPIRTTYIGRIEERMPLLGIILPEGLKKKYPHLEEALNSHTERLLSWYDIYQTLMDIVNDELGLDEPTKPRLIKTLGKSIFRKFNESRSCLEFGIPLEYCVCEKEAPLRSDSKIALESAVAAVNYINKLLIDSKNFTKPGELRVCANLSLINVTLASSAMRRLVLGDSTINILVRVMFYVSPSLGMFDATVVHQPGSPLSVLGDINRINKYGDQPSCIVHQILRLYCFCVDQDYILETYVNIGNSTTQANMV